MAKALATPFTVIVLSKDPDIMHLTDKIITLDDGKVTDIQINKK
jgi:ABC-type protease/lipase transport system fused ATPase/permease subunit